MMTQNHHPKYTKIAICQHDDSIPHYLTTVRPINQTMGNWSNRSQRSLGRRLNEVNQEHIDN